MQQHTLSRFLSSLSSGYPTLLTPNPNLFGRPANGYQPAAVLLALVRHQNQWQVLLTRRADTLRHHTGQIALAGGRRDPQDINFTATALREAEEEIGTPPHIWQTFAAMPPYYTPSGYAVHTIPALLAETPSLTPNPQEVAEVFYVPLEFVLNPSNYHPRTVQYQNRTRKTSVLPYENRDIWGLTAAILYSLSECYQIFRQQTPDQPSS